jgi:hypothetical protein
MAHAAAQTPYYGGNVAYKQHYSAQGMGPGAFPAGAGTGVQLVGLGQAPTVKAVANFAGAAVGGAAVGWVASNRNMRGAYKGAAMTVGFTSLAKAVDSWGLKDKLWSGVYAAIGAGALWWAIMGKRR